MSTSDSFHSTAAMQPHSKRPSASLNDLETMTGLGDIMKSVIPASPDMLVEDVIQHFQKHSLITTVPVVDKGVPVGVVVRDRLFQRLASKFGYSLYGNKQISKVMETDPLIVDIHTPLETLSRSAMARDPEHVYDEVLVTDMDVIAGTISVQAILNAVTTRQIELARDSNPLTGLPGNRTIEREINRRLTRGEGFAIVYTDLDFFKWFNDQFGFQTGDAIIAYTADVLRRVTEAVGNPTESFIGHIGGDDFIIMTSLSSVNALCQGIIEQFDAGVQTFYPDPMRNLGTTGITNRLGHAVPAQGLSISLSALRCEQWGQATTIDSIAQRAGELKKQAKSTLGSTYVVGALE